MKAYTPQVVSIGPIHYSKEGLKAMQDLKLQYLQIFLEWTTISLEDAVKFYKAWERRIRSFYAPTIDLDDGDEFLEMVLVDAAFIIAIFISFLFPELKGGCDNGYLLDKTGYFKKEIFIDKIMLENQLPVFVLVDLFELAKKNLSSDQRKWDSNIYMIMYDFFRVRTQRPSREYWELWYKTHCRLHKMLPSSIESTVNNGITIHNSQCNRASQVRSSIQDNIKQKYAWHVIY